MNPSPASATAAARPTPVPAPVITAILAIADTVHPRCRCLAPARRRYRIRSANGSTVRAWARRCTVQRSAMIPAAPERIFPLLDDFHAWERWSPWEELDPNMAHTYSGADHGVGAVHEWKGNKKAGEGRMEIIDADPPHRLDLVADLHQAVQVRATRPASRSPTTDRHDRTSRGRWTARCTLMMQIIDICHAHGQADRCRLREGARQARVARPELTARRATPSMNVDDRPAVGARRDLAPVLARVAPRRVRLPLRRAGLEPRDRHARAGGDGRAGSRDITWIAFDGHGRRRALAARLGVADRLRRPARDSSTSARGWRACTSRRGRAAAGSVGRLVDASCRSRASAGTTTSTSSPPGRTPTTSTAAGGRSPRSTIAVTARS